MVQDRIHRDVEHRFVLFADYDCRWDHLSLLGLDGSFAGRSAYL
jgi:hypothetical protein